MPKPRKKPTLPSADAKPGDMGAAGHFVVAQSVLTAKPDPSAPQFVAVPGARACLHSLDEPMQSDANGRSRRRVLHVLEVMAGKGQITRRQSFAGLVLAQAWADTHRMPGCDLADPVVDNSPRPDDRTLILIERQARYARISRQVPRASRPVVDHVCLQGRSLRDGMARNGAESAALCKKLAIGLDALAEWLDNHRL